MAEPFKSDSGKRRSALTSAFEELALHTANLNDEVRPNSTTRPGRGSANPPPDRDNPSPRIERRENPSSDRARSPPTPADTPRRPFNPPRPESRNRTGSARTSPTTPWGTCASPRMSTRFNPRLNPSVDPPRSAAARSSQTTTMRRRGATGGSMGAVRGSTCSPRRRGRRRLRLGGDRIRLLDFWIRLLARRRRQTTTRLRRRLAPHKKRTSRGARTLRAAPVTCPRRG